MVFCSCIKAVLILRMSHFAHSFLQHLPPSELCSRSIKIIERWKKHHVLSSEMEIIHDGWLIKLSSDRRLFRRKRWNKYWFVLLHPAHNSGQIILEYYKDSNCHNLRGRIDLGECEQLDSGLLFEKKENVGSNGFDIRTGNKIYYLIAETELEMNKWVGCISSVCGLKLKVEDDQAAAVSLANGIEPVTSPPLTLSTENETDSLGNQKSSNPYILISECFTGKPLPNWPSDIGSLNYSYPRETGLRFPFSGGNYDYPKPTSSQDAIFENNFIHELYQVPPPPRICETDFNNKTYSYVERPSIDDSQEIQTFEGINLGNSIFMYNSGPAIYHDENSDIEAVRKDALQLAQQLEKLGLDDCSIGSENHDTILSPSSDCNDKLHFQSKEDGLDAEVLIPPPRPPKPPDLHKRKSSNPTPFLNKNNVLDLPSSSQTTDTNDVHCITQTAQPVGDNALQPHSETTPVLLDEMYDIPKPRREDNLTILFTAIGLCSKENLHVYDNAPPMFAKSSAFENEEKFCLDQDDVPFKFLEEQSIESNAKDSGIIFQDKYYDIPPLVDRNLKPKRTVPGKDDGKVCHLSQPFDLGNCTIEASYSHSDRDKRVIDLDTNVERPLLSKTGEIQYLDLNLDGDVTNDTSKLEASQAKRTTVYKTVDFLRTEAFNKMRQNVEAAYRSSH